MSGIFGSNGHGIDIMPYDKSGIAVIRLGATGQGKHPVLDPSCSYHDQAQRTMGKLWFKNWVHAVVAVVSTYMSNFRFVPLLIASVAIFFGLVGSYW